MEIYTTSVQFISPDNFGVRVAVFYNSRALFSAEGKQLAIVGWCSVTKNIFVQKIQDSRLSLLSLSMVDTSTKFSL